MKKNLLFKFHALMVRVAMMRIMKKMERLPFGFVRWTEQRNFEAVLDLMASGSIDVKPLISHRLRLMMLQRSMKASINQHLWVFLLIIKIFRSFANRCNSLFK